MPNTLIELHKFKTIAHLDSFSKCLSFDISFFWLVDVPLLMVIVIMISFRITGYSNLHIFQNIRYFNSLLSFKNLDFLLNLTKGGRVANNLPKCYNGFKKPIVYRVDFKRKGYFTYVAYSPCIKYVQYRLRVCTLQAEATHCIG